MSYLLAIIAGWMLVFGIVLAVVSWVAYRRASSRRLLMVAGAFAVFFVKGVLLAFSAFNVGPDVLLASSMLDLAILTLLAFSVLRP